jgi:hypothetical protein
VSFAFIANSVMPSMVSAQTFGGGLILPEPGTMVSVSPIFEPALIKGLTVHRDNPFLFDFIVDPGKSKLSKEVLKNESERMIKYFFAALTIPDKDIWVNLSPYEKDRMIPASLGATAMGRDLLAQDYMLKQLTASLIYPQKALGKSFWDKVYTSAKEMYGTTQIPVNTFNKVWIVPQKAGVYERGQTAFIVNGHLKVMLEQDYLSMTKHNAIANPSSVPTSNTNQLGSQILRQIILPEIEKEVNEGRNFSSLRQIFYAQVLAVWFKRNLKQALLNQVYANKGTVKGIDQNDVATNEAIYREYLRAYKKGVFNFIQEDIDPVTQETLPRKYFSGGYGEVDKMDISKAQLAPEQVAEASQHDFDFAVLAVRPQDATKLDAAMYGAVDNKEFRFASAGLTLNLRNFNNNVAGTSEGIVSVGSSMLMRNLAPEAKDFPRIFITPKGPWVGADGSNIFQVYFPVFANWAFHKRKTVFIVRDADERKRVEQYLRYGNEYDRPANLEYLPPEQAAELKREAYYLGDRFPIEDPASPRIVNVIKDLVEIYTMEEAKAKIGLEIKDLPEEGVIEVKDKDQVFKLQSTNLREFELSFPSEQVEPVREHPNFGVTFLGTSSAMDPNGLGVGHVVWAGKTGILYDLNPSTILGLRKLGLSPKDISYVVLTHTHEDHVAGTLAYLNWAKEQGVKVKIIAEPVVWYYLNQLIHAEADQELEKLFDVDYIPMKFYQDLYLSGQVLLESAPAFHGTTTAMTRVTYQGRTIGLSSDTTMPPPRFKAIRENRLPEFIQRELKEFTGWDGHQQIMTDQRIDELDGSTNPQSKPGFLFKPNHSGKSPELVVYEAGFPRPQPTTPEDLANHTSGYDLKPLAEAFPHIQIITNHAAALPAGIEGNNLKHAKAFTTVSLDAAMRMDITKTATSQVNDSRDKAALAKPWVQGGIDLSQQDSALHVEKDANGGVKVNVDQALIARIEREGMTEVIPVIIDMKPADIQTLFKAETPI